jgi:hypothetical protein
MISGHLAILLAMTGLASAATEKADVVTYEAFGAIGDGKTDDLPAICKAHEHANKMGLAIRSNPDATYHLGGRALTATIQTDTDWSTSRFLIDDSAGVENSGHSIFEVISSFKPISLKIDQLKRGQDRLDLKLENDCLVYVENKNRKRFIRRGANQNEGKAQSEVFILRRDGSIEGGIEWDYDVITKISAQPIDPKLLTIRGGIFATIANQMKPSDEANYWDRNIHISRSNVVIDGIVNRVVGETDSGHPYSGFLYATHCANITLRNCKIDGHKTYMKIGNDGTPVSMGSYGYGASYVVNLLMSKCRMDDIHDRSRWGVVGTNFMKNFAVEDCELSRVDVHMGVSGHYIIRRTTLGHAGLNAIGRGLLIVEDSTLHGRNLISFRPDYGATWEGSVIIRNSRWTPRDQNDSTPVLFGAKNDGMHDFGYPCFMPQSIQIDGLLIDDSNRHKNYKEPIFFDNTLAGSGQDRPFPYQLTKKIEVKGLRTASGKVPKISTNPKMAQAISVEGL